MKKLLFLAAFAAFTTHGIAQDTLTLANYKTPLKEGYWLSASEIIFSWGNVEASGLDVSPVVRFSAFFHLGQQFHYDFSKNAGFYTGLSLRNIGMINDLNDSVRIKQRVYTLGIPVAFKFGNMQGTNVAIGAEAEFAFAYKQKVFTNGEKAKTTEWFSDRTNIFLPSTFAEIRTKHGGYIRFKYYLTDFLQESNQKVNVPNLTYRPTQSQLFAVSLGFAIDGKKSELYKDEMNKQKKR